MENDNKYKEQEHNFNPENEAPKLFAIGKENPFVLPPHYFDDLPNVIFDKITHEDKDVNKKNVWLSANYKYALAGFSIAASLFLFFFIMPDNKRENVWHQISSVLIPEKNKDKANSKINNNHLVIVTPEIESNANHNLAIHGKEIELNQTKKNLPDNLLTQSNNFYQKSEKSLISQSNPNRVKQNPGDFYQIEKNNSKYAFQHNFIDNSGTQTANNSNARQGNKNQIENKSPSNFDEFPIEKESLPIINLGKEICSDKYVVLDAGKDAKKCNFLWNTGENTPTIHVNKTGVYSVTVTLQGTSVSVTDQVNVKIIPPPKVNLGPDYDICESEPLVLYAIENEKFTDEYTYEWSPSGQNTSFIRIENLIPGIYKYAVRVTGCSSIFDEITITVNDCSIEIPNVFTPNNDGKNDYFVIDGLEKYPNSELIIYDRNRKKVYQSLDYRNNWNGDRNPDGVYFYLLRIADQNRTIRKGTVTLYSINLNQ